MKILNDKYGRRHDYLRVSLTDKCNLNCTYCNPENQNYDKLNMSQILSFDELARLIHIFVTMLGFTKVRLTGGEPLIRNNIISLFEMLSQIKTKNEFELGITTNGTLLEDKIERLQQLGLNKINISLDTLSPEKFNKITGHDDFHKVIRSINKTEAFGYSPVKINSVIMKGINDDEILDLVEFVKDRDFNIRFIEYMPFTSNGWGNDKFISFNEIKEIIETKYNLIAVVSDKANVASEFKIAEHKVRVSFISSISNHFCDGCNRLRITSEGNLRLCLFSSKDIEIPLKNYLRSTEYSDEDIAEVIANSLEYKELKHPKTDELLQMDQNNMLRIGG